MLHGIRNYLPVQAVYCQLSFHHIKVFKIKVVNVCKICILHYVQISFCTLRKSSEFDLRSCKVRGRIKFLNSLYKHLSNLIKIYIVVLEMEHLDTDSLICVHFIHLLQRSNNKLRT